MASVNKITMVWLATAGSSLLLALQPSNAGPADKTAAITKANAKAKVENCAAAATSTKTVIKVAKTQAGKAGKPSAKGAATKCPPKAATPEPAKEKVSYDGKPVLNPSGYFGAAAMGYASAKAAPEVMSHLFCYCGCDMSDSHSWLIDCFTSDHGRDCHICQEEAVLALRLHRDGASITEIQQRIDQDFSKHYPFEEPTATYKKYKENRLWTKAEGSTSDVKPKTAGPEPATTGSAPAKPPKVKEGFSVGTCCGKDEHQDSKKK